MEWWPVLIFHRGGLRIKVINNNAINKDVSVHTKVSLNVRHRVVSPARVLALFTVGDVYASLCKKGAYAPFGAQRRSRALFYL